MRTTLNLDEDVLLAIKERARRDGRTAGEVLSELARQALTRSDLASLAGEERGFYGFDPLPNRGPAVSNAQIDELREDERE